MNDLSREVIIGQEPDLVVSYGLNLTTAEDLADVDIASIVPYWRCDGNGSGPSQGDVEFEDIFGQIEELGRLLGAADVASASDSHAERQRRLLMQPLPEIQRFWDADAATYDPLGLTPPVHGADPSGLGKNLERLLPPPPSRVLDVGAGTGFLSLLAAGLGRRVTALDLSAQMLDRLRVKAGARGLDVETVEATADQPPDGDFDVVIERHVVWTLPDPGATLARWHEAVKALLHRGDTVSQLGHRGGGVLGIAARRCMIVTMLGRDGLSLMAGSARVCRVRVGCRRRG